MGIDRGSTVAKFKKDCISFVQLFMFKVTVIPVISDPVDLMKIFISSSFDLCLDICFAWHVFSVD